MDELKVILEFQRRRKSYIRKSIPGMLLAAVGLGLCIYATGGGGEAPPEKFSIFVWGMATAFAGGLWAFILACIIYRCPVCNSIPVTEASGCESDNAINIFPRNCAKCGARLK